MSQANRISNLQRKLKDNRFPQSEGCGSLFLAQNFARNKLDGFIVTNPTNILYLTGFKGALPQERESILVFNPGVYPSKPSLTRQSGATLITTRLYQNEARHVKSKNLKIKIVDERNQILESLKTLLAKAKRVGFEEESLTFSEYQEFEKYLKVLIPTKNFVEDFRLIKTEDEIKKIENGQIISQKAFEILVKTIKVGEREAEIAEKLEKIIKSLGADNLAFESIVASGKNSGLPHHITGKQKIKKGQVLLLDFGAKYKDYCADLTRTIFIGRAKDSQRNIYHHVLSTQRTTLGKIAHGQKASDIYHAANNVFKKQKLEEFFLHGLGHGIGLESHERPYLRPTIDEPLLENMIFSIEPGLYFPWGGIRIEDLVVVKDGHAKTLGKLSGEIIEI